MKYLIFWFFILVLISPIFAECEDNQIDINSASLERLEELDGIGPVKSQSIVDSRPFEDIDDLLKVTGIGDKTLENIKNQDIVCIEEEEEEEGEEEEEKEDNEKRKENLEEEIKNETTSQIIKEKVIYLGPKNIKSSKKIIFESKSEQIKKYSIYVFALFCILLIGLLLKGKNG